jgi:Putative peptidoglycan binding domain
MRCSAIEARDMQATPRGHAVRRVTQVAVVCLLLGLASCASSDAGSTATTLSPGDTNVQITTSGAAVPTPTDNQPPSLPAPPPTDTQPTGPATDPAPPTDAPTTSASDTIVPAGTVAPRLPPITVTCTGPFRANDTLPITPCQKGSVVVDIQKALVGFGYDITADGLYGQATADAVQSFQYVMGLPQTGVVDEATFTALGIDAEVDF